MVKAFGKIVRLITAAFSAAFLFYGLSPAAGPFPPFPPPGFPAAPVMPPFPSPTPIPPFPAPGAPGPPPFPITVPPYPPPTPKRIPNFGVEVLASNLPSPGHIIAKGPLLIWSQSGESPVEKMGINGGQPVPLAMKIGVPENIIVIGRHIYWIDGFTVKDTNPDTGGTSILSRGKRNYGESAFGADGKNLYWVNSRPGRWTINRVPMAGGESSIIGRTSQEIVSLAFDSPFVYYEEKGQAGSAIRRVPATGGPAETIVDNGLNGLAPSAGRKTGWQAGGGIAITNGQIYFSGKDYSGDRLFRVSVNGGQVSVAAKLNAAAIKITAGGQNVYWADSDSIRRLPTGGGPPVVLAGGLHSPADIAVADGSVYWTETVCCGHGQKGSIKKAPAGGGGISVLASEVDAPGPIAVGSRDLYWGEGGQTGLAEGFGRIAEVPLGGGGVRTVASGISSDHPPIAADNLNIYVADRLTIKKIPLSGGQAEKFYAADSTVVDIAADNRFVYWIEDQASTVRMEAAEGGPVETVAAGRGPAGRLVVDSSSIYWVDDYDTIKRVTISGGPVGIIGRGLGRVTDIAASSGNIYYLESDRRDIRSVSTFGGPAMTLTGFINPPGSIAADMNSLYWADSSGVGEVSRNGGPPAIVATGLASGPEGPNYIAVDGANIYWTEAGGGFIKKAPK